MGYNELVDGKRESLVDLATIEELRMAKDLANVIRIVYKRKVSLESLINEIRIQHKEAGENSPFILYSPKGILTRPKT